MKTDNTYNGWTNYATWRVNLEMFDQLCPADFWGFEDGVKQEDCYEFSKVIKDYAEEIIEQTSEEGLARDYALAFLSDVNWYEIAQHIIEETEATE